MTVSHKYANVVKLCNIARHIKNMKRITISIYNTVEFYSF